VPKAWISVYFVLAFKIYAANFYCTYSSLRLIAFKRLAFDRFFILRVGFCKNRAWLVSLWEICIWLGICLSG